MPLARLPIDDTLEKLCTTLLRDGTAVLQAPAGAGKTTRVPRALLDAGLSGNIVVLEPRRMAARLSAMRVAFELGETVGQTVGYQTRFERSFSRATRILFVTEGILSRRLLSDPTLTGTSAVLLDEFHERHLQADVALAWMRHLRQTSRPDLLVLPMSATLETEQLAQFLGAEVVRSEGRAYPLEIEHLAKADDRPLASQVASAVRRALKESAEGHVLVFLPGAREIRAATEAVKSIAESEDALVFPLHGSLRPEEQDRAVLPNPKRKVILSTNVAETSVTIDGVQTVVDSGLAFNATVAPWSGFSSLKIHKVARASLDQRAGRAGRTGPGRCLRLFTAGDASARPRFDEPEIRRLDLAETVLEIVAAGIPAPEQFGWFDAPDPKRIESSTALLVRLGAVTGPVDRLSLSERGKRMLRFPVHPRLARLLVEAEDQGIAGDAALLAAFLGERDIRTGNQSSKDAVPMRSDLLRGLEDLEDARGATRERMRWLGLDPERTERVFRAAKQLEAQVKSRVPAPTSPKAYDEAFDRVVLAGYSDRVGRLRTPENATGRRGSEIVLAGGGTAMLSPRSVVGAVDLVLAVDAEERSEGGRTALRVEKASSISADLLLDVFIDQVVDETETVIAPSGRVEEVRRLRFGSLILEETRSAPRDGEAIARALARSIREKGLELVGGEGVSKLLRRISFAKQSRQKSLCEDSEALIDSALENLCLGHRTIEEVAAAGLARGLEDSLPPATQRALSELCPTQIELPSGRSLEVQYHPDGPPSVESRLQDFFGMARGPTVAGGAVPIVLHLLAPNYRAVQVTTDLAGFWERHYPAVAKELRRKYPRHPFPDDPLHSTPPPPRAPRPPRK